MRKFLTLGYVLIIATICKAQVTLPQLKVEDFMEDFDQPLGIENCGDARLFIVEQGGKVWITYPDGSRLPDPFLDISSRVFTEGEEQGLLGLTFDPDYATNGYLYVNYTTKPIGNTRIARFTVSAADPNNVNENSEVTILKIKQPFENHNGGQLRFGPDGYLYIAMGDGGYAGDPAETAQNPGVMLGKILRIDVHGGDPYSVPESNPFVSEPGYLPEIWATGLRNPWRFSFDRLTGDLWLADVGQDRYEEVNFQEAASMGGENYGWDCKEGLHKFETDNCTPAEALSNPIAEYTHDGFDCTVVGGFVYRGSLYPNMMGKYFYADYCSGRFRTIFKVGDFWHNVLLIEEEPFQYVTFGEDMNGEIYVADIEEGEIYKLIDTTAARMGSVVDDQNTVLFPNPSDGQFNVRWIASESGTSTIKIFNTFGQELSEETTATNTGINLWSYSNSKLLPGSYVLTITTNNAAIKKQFIIHN